MTILALEFSSPQRSVAISRNGNVLAEAVENGGRNTAAFGMIEKVLGDAKIEREEVDAIVVGLGPGSYTGIRSAIAISQGWQLVCELKLIGCSSMEAIAAQAQAEKIFGRVNIAIDAQRNEFYLATYEISAADWKELEPLRIVPLTEIQSLVDGKQILIGPEVSGLFPLTKTIFPTAAALTRMTTAKCDAVPGEKLEPIYLRETNFVKTPRPSSV
jgi:tRNA threonylcarbamoyl adenosine modification protein YeaZ